MVNLKLSVGCLLTLTTLTSGWEHVTADELQSSLENHDVSVVACKLLKNRMLLNDYSLTRDRSCFCRLLLAPYWIQWR